MTENLRSLLSAFITPPKPPQPAAPPAAALPADSADLRSDARQAAQRLIDDLHDAEQRSRGWLDADRAQALIDAALSRCLARLTATGCTGDANRLPSGELWAVAGPLLQAGSLQLRAREKPRGYAGDYELLAAICENTTCDDPLGRIFDRYFLAQAAPKAVRARTRAIADTLIEFRPRHPGAFHVVNVGAGPAIDVELALREMPADERHDVRVTLLDMDPAALDNAQGRLAPFLPDASLQCIRTNLARLPRARNLDELLPPSDLLICAGLFDYLAADAADDMLRLFYARLAPGGLLLVGNFTPENSTRAYMEWIGNWYLTYRTPDEMHRLALAAGIPKERFRVVCERTGIDLFLAALKP